VTQYQYDAAGQVIAVIDPLGQTATYSYDNLGRKIGMTLPDPDGGGPLVAPQYTYAYDDAGNLASETDPEGHTTQYEYDALGQLLRVVDANGDATDYVYDAAGNMLSLTDPVGNTTTWVYDELDRVIQETNQLGDSRYYAYDDAGNLARYTDRNGRVTEYDYDALHRLIEERWLDGQTVLRTIDYAYDAAGQLLGVDDAEADYSYTYDTLGRATSSSLDLAGLGQTVALAYSYDNAGRRSELSAAIGSVEDFVTSYAYDTAGRLASVEQSGAAGGNAVAEKRVDFAYDASGRTSAITRYANSAGTELVAGTTFTYDSAGRLTDLTHSQNAVNLAGYTWTYDAAGRMTQFTSLLDGTVNYTHDATGQLTGADYDYQTDESYTYDANGNRTNTGYSTGANNQLLSDGTYNYEYDAEGNRVKRTEIATGHVTEYEWDHRNRMVRVTERDSDTGPATQVVQHTYDYLNRWVARAVDSDGDGPLGFDDTYFIYDGAPGNSLSPWERVGVRAVGTEGLLDAVGQIVLQFDDNAQGDPQLTHRYLWGPAVDQILADEQVTDVVQEGNILWPLTDHLGTVRDLAEYDNVTDTTTVQNHRTYNAFGQLISETNAAVDHLFAFTGRATDESTGLQNNLNRWYDAAVGRWLSQDPIAFGGGDANLYRYVRSGPLSAIDPTGLDDIRINKLIANVVQWMPEGWFNRDQPWGAVDIGTVDRHGVVTFFSQYKLNPMPLSILKEYGGADTIGELIANLRKAQAANPKNIWSGGQSVADYWSLRLTQAEINKWGEEAAVKAANDRILKRALALAGLEQGYSTVEGGAGVVLGGLGTIALLNSWNPVGWGCLIAAAGIGGKGVKDYTDTWDIQRAGSDAARYYCNPDALVP
jgi:RHS repeat-associated protein